MRQNRNPPPIRAERALIPIFIGYITAKKLSTDSACPKAQSSPGQKRVTERESEHTVGILKAAALANDKDRPILVYDVYDVWNADIRISRKEITGSTSLQ